MPDSSYSSLFKLLKLDACFRNPNPEKCTIQAILDKLSNDPEFEGKISRSSLYEHIKNFRLLGAEFKGRWKSNGSFIAPRADSKQAYFQYSDINSPIPKLQEILGKQKKDTGTELLNLLEHEQTEGNIDPSVVWLRVFLKEMLKGNEISLKSISFYENTDLMMDNIDKFEQLLEAICNKKPLRIHYAYNKLDEIKIMPYRLKNYNQRWYLIGKQWIENKRPENPYNFYKGFTFLAINGIVDKKDDAGNIIIPAIQPWEGIEYLEPENQHIDEYFECIIGITPNREGPQDVYLRFNPTRYEKYVKTKPLSGTQKLVKKGEYYDETRPTLHLHVHINKELEQQILSFGPDCEVIAPDSLRNSIKQKIETMMAAYK